MTTRAPKQQQQEQQNAPPLSPTRASRQRLPLCRRKEQETPPQAPLIIKQKNRETQVSFETPQVSFDMPPKKRQKKGAGTAPVKKRTRNFVQEENIWLARAYVNVSENPVKGVGQKIDVFWRQIKQSFDVLKAEEGYQESQTKDVDWSWEQLRERFQRAIARPVLKFNKYYKQVKTENPSGANQDDILELAAERYREAEGRAFTLTACVAVLHEMPRFDPMIELETISVDDDEEEEDAGGGVEVEEDGEKKPAAKKSPVNTVGTPMGANMVRPMGSKMAKKMYKDEVSMSSSGESAKAEAVAKLADTQSQLVAAINNHTQISSLSHQSDHAYRMWQMAQATGNQAQLNYWNDVMANIQMVSQPPPMTPVPGGLDYGGMQEREEEFEKVLELEEQGDQQVEGDQLEGDQREAV